MEGIIQIDENDLDGLRKLAKTNKDIVALMFEPIQGEGGVNPIDLSAMKEYRRICDENDWLLMVDEIQLRARTFRQMVCSSMGRN